VTNAIEISDLHVSIAGSHVLQGVSFTVPTGGVTALLGRNGVGKTTTLRAILGLVASSGRIQVLGDEVGPRTGSFDSGLATCPKTVTSFPH